MTGRTIRQRERNLRFMAKVSLTIALLCVLSMARYVDCEIRQIKQSTRDAEARAAAAVAESNRAKDRYLQKLEELGACKHGN